MKFVGQSIQKLEATQDTQTFAAMTLTLTWWSWCTYLT